MMTLFEFFFAILLVALIVLQWVVIDHLRRIVDGMHTALAMLSARRRWVKEEHRET